VESAFGKRLLKDQERKEITKKISRRYENQRRRGLLNNHSDLLFPDVSFARDGSQSFYSPMTHESLAVGFIAWLGLSACVQNSQPTQYVADYRNGRPNSLVARPLGCCADSSLISISATPIAQIVSSAAFTKQTQPSHRIPAFHALHPATSHATAMISSTLLAVHAGILTSR